MDRKKKTLNLIIEQGIIPAYCHRDAAVSIQILKALYRAGCRVVEFTSRGEAAINIFLQLRKVADTELPGLQLGAGDIRNKIEATEFINEGANFITCPGVNAGVSELAKKNDLLWIPGCLTATEISVADELGAEIVKLFPGNLLGPSYLSSMKEIFPDLLFMPAGGIETSEENLKHWFKMGATAIGTKLICEKYMEMIDYTGIESSIRQTLQTLREITVRHDCHLEIVSV